MGIYDGTEMLCFDLAEDKDAQEEISSAANDAGAGKRTGISVFSIVNGSDQELKEAFINRRFKFK